jgi:hypothetical protein
MKNAMRRFRFILVAVSAVLIVTPPGRAADSPAPMFAAFLKFCVATGAKPDAMKTAVEMAGGVARNPPGATDWPFRVTTQSWDYTTLGHELTVSAGTANPPAHGNRPGVASINCIINSTAPDDASLEALRRWAGVPVSDKNAGGLTYYYFRDRKDTHVPIVARNAADWQAIEAEGYWTLVLIHIGGSAALQLVFSQATSPVPP